MNCILSLFKRRQSDNENDKQRLHDLNDAHPLVETLLHAPLPSNEKELLALEAAIAKKLKVINRLSAQSALKADIYMKKGYVEKREKELHLRQQYSLAIRLLGRRLVDITDRITDLSESLWQD
jgi:hypothetical protein